MGGGQVALTESGSRVYLGGLVHIQVPRPGHTGPKSPGDGAWASVCFHVFNCDCLKNILKSRYDLHSVKCKDPVTVCWVWSDRDTCVAAIQVKMRKVCSPPGTWIRALPLPETTSF